MTYPLLMAPYYRHGDDTPWGGSNLRDWFGKDIPDERTGESLEISALPHMPSSVVNGELAGKTLPEVIAAWGSDLTGDIDGEFPLLAKLIDAREMLSLQVHPDDAYARQHEGKLGKTEAWVVLSAPHGAKLVYGVNGTKAELKAAIDKGELESALRFVNVAPGDVLYMPHGMVHALGSGIIIYEIQQSSDVTYRFWDWGRMGTDGQPRPLHMDKAFDVTDCSLNLGKLPGATVITEGGSATAYISDGNFELWRLNVAGRMPLGFGRMLFITPLGPCKLTWPDGELDLAPLSCTLIPAHLEGVALEGALPVLMSTTPDHDAIRAQLGYRASAVAGLG